MTTATIDSALATSDARPPAPLGALLADAGDGRGARLSADEILNRFVGYATSTGLALYPAQEEALLELVSGKHIILNTPTG